MSTQLSREDVVAAYRFILGREPENSDVIEHFQRTACDLNRLRAALFESKEFERTKGRYQQPVLIHMHIPKTAGSTINRILVENHAGKNIFNYQDYYFGHGLMADFFQLDEKKRENIDVFFGHIRYGVHRFLREDHLYFFCLREPRARILSLFRYIRTQAAHPFHDSARNRSFGDYLSFIDDLPHLRSAYDNAQIVQIAGLSTLHDTIDYDDALRRACDVAFSPNVMFGLTENLDAFLQRLRDRGVLTHTPDYRENVAPQKSNIESEMTRLSSRQRDILDRYTRYDQAFFNICSTYLSTIKTA